MDPLTMPGLVRDQLRRCVLACLSVVACSLLAGCGMDVIAGPAETITIQPLAGEDLSSGCVFDLNMPDQPLAKVNQPTQTAQTRPVEAGVLVVYERGDSATLFQDDQVQAMAASLHLVTVFAHECDATSTGDLQSDATKGPGRALFAALAKYAIDTTHPEIPTAKLVLSGFSAAGVLSITMAQAYPDRVLTILPYASGSAYINMDTIQVSDAMAHIPTLVLANAYDSKSGDQRSLRFFERGWAMGAPWALAVQNHTDHCCTLSTRDLMIPWITALTPSTTTGAAVPSAAFMAAEKLPATPSAVFTPYTDGWPDAQGEISFWLPAASVLPDTTGGSMAAWLPDAATTQAWLKWVTSPGTN